MRNIQDPSLAKELTKLVHQAITNQIRLADQAQSLADVIGEQADRINAAGFGQLFGSLQVILADELVLRVTKLFDVSHGRYPTLGIPTVLDFLEANAPSLPVLNRPTVERELRVGRSDSTEFAALSDAQLTISLVQHYRSVLPKADANSRDQLSAALGALRFRRDKEIAHNEKVEPTERIRAEWDHGRQLLAFAKKLVGLIGECYMGFNFESQDGTYMLTRYSLEVGESLESLLRRASVLSDEHVTHLAGS